MTIQFEHPYLLLLAPLALAATYWLWRTSRAYMPPRRRVAALLLRATVMLLLVLAVASPLLRLRANQLDVAVLLDRSDSIGPAGWAQEEQWLSAALAAKDNQDQAAVITFGADANVERPLDPSSQPPPIPPSPPAGFGASTNIAAAIRAGVAALPPTAARRIVLLTDGQENADSAQDAAALAAAAGVQIMAVPITQGSGPEVALNQVVAPGQIREGEQFSVTVQAVANVATTATINVLVDGKLAATQNVSLNNGVSRFAMTLAALSTGNHVVQAEIEPADDTEPQNNTAGAIVVVTGPPRVLVVEGTPGEGQFLADALRAQNIDVDVSDPATAPLDQSALHDYATVALVDVPSQALGDGQMSALKGYVQDFGGGLVVIGGDNAYGPGGYARTPLEDMLPVTMNLHGQSLSTSTALILVVDNSGSMGEGPQGASKMDLAKQAADAAAELLGSYDKIGVVAFEDTPRWAVQPTSAADLADVESAISEMQPGGGTEIYPALQMAYQGLAPLDAKVKHIILLTDGDAPRGDYPGLTAQMRAANISLSTIGIGADADTQLLQELAQLGNGRYYDGNDPFNLPQLVVKETQQVQRAAIVEQDFRPVGLASNPVLSGLDLNSMPLLKGYVATSLKPQSTPILWSNQGDPVLSEWQYGLGRVLAWTSDARNKWAANWVQWPDFSRFWAQVIKYAARPPQDPNRDLSVQVNASQAQITLDARAGTTASDLHYLNYLPTTATVTDPRGQQVQVPMPQVAPGRYQASLPVQDDGAYSVDVKQTDADGNQVMTSGGFVVPYSPEYRLSGAQDTSLLSSITKQTGGGIIHDPAQAFTHDLLGSGAPEPLWPYLVVAAGILLVADVGVRRVRFSRRELRQAYGLVRTRLGYTDEPAVTAARPVAPVVRITPQRSPVSGVPAAKLVQPPGASQPGAGARQSSRLLAAKQRASRR